MTFRNSVFAIFLVFGIFIIPRCLAQGCANGIPSANNPACLPPDDPQSPYYNGGNGQSQSSGPKPVGKWIKTWGAFANDKKSGAAGFSTGQFSKREAESAAIRHCKSQELDGSNCVVTISYKNQCVAIAQGAATQSGFATGFASGGSPERAGSAAIRECSTHGGECKVIYSNCTEPFLKRFD